MNEAEERKAFEAWAKENNNWPFLSPQEALWKGWKARATIAPTNPLRLGIEALVAENNRLYQLSEDAAAVVERQRAERLGLAAERDALKAQAAADADAAAWAAGCVTEIIDERVTEIIAERDALKADAERYRWLRDPQNGRVIVRDYGLNDAAELDAAIDAARGEKSNG